MAANLDQPAEQQAQVPPRRRWDDELLEPRSGVFIWVVQLSVLGAPPLSRVAIRSRIRAGRRLGGGTA
jgi:hypothetical protein